MGEWSRSSAGTTTSGATAAGSSTLSRRWAPRCQRPRPRRRPSVHRPRSVRDVDVAGKRVLVRSDLNVPLEGGRVADETRIQASLPTLRLLLQRGAAQVRVCSHLGRPKGPDPAFSIEPVRARLRELLPDERIELLENTRFNPGETKNDPGFARELEHLGRLLGDVERPFVLVSGGAKVEDKLGVLRKLGGKADRVLVGGKMAEELRER